MSGIADIFVAITPEVITFLRTLRKNRISANDILAAYDDAKAEGRVMTAADILPHKTEARAAIDRLGD